MTELVVVYFLVIEASRGVTVIPAPFATKYDCASEATRISLPVAKGGMPSGYAYCVEVKTPVKKEQK
jgi:hypothetical protein